MQHPRFRLFSMDKASKKNGFHKMHFGMSIQIIPTLAELVGRTGQTYEAMVPSLFNQGPFVFNHRLWMDKTGIYVEDEKNAASIC